MAGIGFELKKLFTPRGIIKKAKAYAYAGFVCTGPMILGTILILAVKFIGTLAKASNATQDVLTVTLTYCIIYSLLLTSILSMVATRYLADVLFENKYERVMPCFYGVVSILLIVGIILSSVFVARSTLTLAQKILFVSLFAELTVVWVQINFISAVTDYKQISMGFVYAILASVISALILVFLIKAELVASLMLSVCVGYGVMIVNYSRALHRYFPIGKGSPIRFVEWLERYPQLIVIGFFLSLGVFIHIIMTWYSEYGETVAGVFKMAPIHDIASFFAFLSVIPTTLNFTTSVEVNFYPTYRKYYGLIAHKGSLSDIKQAYNEMLTVLKQEIFYLAQKQLLVTLFFVTIAGELIHQMGFGFTASALGVFRVLCIGYGLYAIGNSITMMELYFVDYKGGVASALVLFAVNTIATGIMFLFPQRFMGIGFVIAGLAMYIVAWIRIRKFTQNLDYHVFCQESLLFEQKDGMLTKLAKKSDEKAMNK